jgi:chromosomal replication initiation ATPase DnaA
MRKKKFPKDTKNLSLISSAVCQSFGIDTQSFLSPLRKRDLVFARHAFCYLARTRTNHSLLDIGFFLGNRDHSTVINSIRQCSDLLEFHNEFRRKYQKSEFAFEKFSEPVENISA